MYKCNFLLIIIILFKLLGQHVDYFDKRVMELIKHRLASSISSHTTSAHHCTFRGQVSHNFSDYRCLYGHS